MNKEEDNKSVKSFKEEDTESVGPPLAPPVYQYPNNQPFSQPYPGYNVQMQQPNFNGFAQQPNFNGFVQQPNIPPVVVPMNPMDLQPFAKRPVARTCPSCNRQVC